MEKVEFYKKDEGALCSNARWCKYFFKNNSNYGLMMIGETDDYFYFTISLKDGMLKNNYNINISQDSIMYNTFNRLVTGFKVIDVMEEGSPEGKSLCFKNQNNSIDITFNLIDEERVFYTIEFANLRRLGDTRFKSLITNDDAEYDVEIEREFRYKFKVRLHQMFDELEKLYTKTQQEIHI